MRLSDFIDLSNRTESPEGMVGLMAQAVDDLGFDRYTYCALTRHDWYDNKEHPPPAVAMNYPTEWTDHYFDKGYQYQDPVLLYTPEIERPFLWDWLGAAYNLEPSQQEVMNYAREANLKDGVGVPLHGPKGNVCLMTFASSNGHADAAENLRTLSALAAQFHTAYSAVARVDNDDELHGLLSVRERECLQWIAWGKTSWDIGMILSISENTVNFHVKNAIRKLGANNRILAVVKAIRFGLISL